MIKRFLLHLLLLAAPAASIAQTLDRYVQEALAQNATLQEKNFQLEKSLAALAEARGLFLPDVSFSTTYTRAEGGRTINLPLGDLLNPVYATLNQLTQSNQFPQLENRREQLNPDDFYDAKIRAVWPLLNAEIRYNRSIKRDLASIRSLDAALYRRELTREVKTAWFTYKQADEAVTIYESALLLVQESERVNARLLQNGKAVPTALRRARNEVVKVEAQLTGARENRQKAAFYFNFLLNRDLKTPIETADPALDMLAVPAAADPVRREEVAQIDKALAVSRQSSALETRFHEPKVNLFVDAGSQGFEWTVDRSTWYYMGGVQISVPIFTGGRHRSRLRQARAETGSLEARRSALVQQLDMQRSAALDAYQSAAALLASARTQREFAVTYYDDMNRLYKEGALLYIELLDAQNQLTGARLQESIAQSRLGIRHAELERCSAPSTN